MITLRISYAAQRIRDEARRLDGALRDGGFATAEGMAIRDLRAAKAILRTLVTEIEKRELALIANEPTARVA